MSTDTTFPAALTLGATGLIGRHLIEELEVGYNNVKEVRQNRIRSLGTGSKRCRRYLRRLAKGPNWLRTSAGKALCNRVAI